LEADFSASRKYAKMIVQQMLQSPPDKHCVLNVNIPIASVDEIKGIKICRQAYAKYEEDFIEREDPHGRKYYWLTGEFVNFDECNDTDVWALANKYVSVVPVQFDLTHYKLKQQLEKNWNILSDKG
jgi:5'-nucleotidase